MPVMEMLGYGSSKKALAIFFFVLINVFAFFDGHQLVARAVDVDFHRFDALVQDVVGLHQI